MPPKPQPRGIVRRSDSEIRWNILVRSARSGLDALAATNFEDLTGPDAEERTDPFSLLSEIQGTLSDLLEIAKLRRESGKVVDNDDILPVDESEPQPERSPDHECTQAAVEFLAPVIPVPILCTDLAKEIASLELNHKKLSLLGTHASAKAHRILLEERSSAQTAINHIRRKIEGLNVESHDLLTIGSALEIDQAINEICKQHPTKKMDFFLFLKNFLAHSIILSLLENLIDPANSQKRPSAIVDRILDLSAESTDHFEELSLLTLSVFDAPAIRRLVLPAHLDKTVNARYCEALSTRQGLSSPKTYRSADERHWKSRQNSKKYTQIEYWMLTRTWVSDQDLMTDSFAISPRTPEERLNSKFRSQSPNTRGTLVKTLPADTSPQIDTDDPIEAMPDEISDNDNSDEQDDEDRDGSTFDLPSVPSNKLPTTDELHTDDHETQDEIEVKQLIAKFAATPTSPTDSDQDEEDPDDSELDNLTAAERDEVLKALASAEEHYVNTWDSSFDGDKSVDEVLQEAKNELKRFGGKQARNMSIEEETLDAVDPDVSEAGLDCESAEDSSRDG